VSCCGVYRSLIRAFLCHVKSFEIRTKILVTPTSIRMIDISIFTCRNKAVTFFVQWTKRTEYEICKLTPRTLVHLSGKECAVPSVGTTTPCTNCSWNIYHMQCITYNFMFHSYKHYEDNNWRMEGCSPSEADSHSLRRNATSRKVSGSFPDKVMDFFFNLPNPSSRTMILGSTQPLTEIIARNNFEQ
jgi:hypothetical protein